MRSQQSGSSLIIQTPRPTVSLRDSRVQEERTVQPTALVDEILQVHVARESRRRPRSRGQKSALRLGQISSISQGLPMCSKTEPFSSRRRARAAHTGESERRTVLEVPDLTRRHASWKTEVEMVRALHDVSSFRRYWRHSFDIITCLLILYLKASIVHTRIVCESTIDHVSVCELDMCVSGIARVHHTCCTCT